MTTGSPPPSPPCALTVRLRLPNARNQAALVLDAVRRWGGTGELGEPIKETATFTIIDLAITCQDLRQSEGIVKALRAMSGVEVMNISLSR